MHSFVKIEMLLISQFHITILVKVERTLHKNGLNLYLKGYSEKRLSDMTATKKKSPLGVALRGESGVSIV